MSAPADPRWIRARMAASAAGVAVLLGLVSTRAYRLQTVESPRLREMAEQQYLREIELPPRRGTIGERHGIPLAVSIEVDSVYANPRMIGAGAPEVARRLGQVLDLDAWGLQRQLSSRRYFAWIKRRVTRQQAHQVKALAVRGVYLTKETRRFYPNQGLGSSVVGFAGADARGLEGVELAFDGWLRGTAQRLAGLRDALGRQVFSEGAQPAEAGSHDVQLTLDKFIQFETERALSDAAAQVKPKTGWVAAVVMDPGTGEILGMASAPSFDPNHYDRASPAQRRNRAVADAFEPGSTMKVFTLGAALELGKVRSEDVFDCEKGRWRVGHYTIHDAHPNDRLTVSGIMKKSSNIGAAKIGMALGKAALYQSLRRFGFGEATQLGLPGERAGVLRPPKRWSDVGLANVSFGQGLTTTVLHLALGFAAVANGGVMMKPRLMGSIRDDRGQVVKESSPVGTQALSRGTAERLLAMMRGVTEPGGTGVAAALDRYTVAGKTGTAQKVDPVTRRYSTDRWVSSFIGIVPATRPRLVIAVVVNEPEGEKHYGGEVAGPLFKRIAEKSLPYLGVKPDRAAREAERRQPELVAAAGEGFVDEDLAPPLPGERERGGDVLVPDFTGMSMAEVLSSARRGELKLQLEGSGRAVAQSPGPGPAPRQTTCRVSFRPPG